VSPQTASNEPTAADLPKAKGDTTRGRHQHLTRAALRAVDDPVQLARAARIIRAALARGALSPADLAGEIVKPTDLQKVRHDGGAS
jgi:hypothetical protein